MPASAQCPYCQAPTSVQASECPCCQASLANADLMEEEKRLHRRLRQRRRWAFGFGVPGILLGLVAGAPLGFLVADVQGHLPPGVDEEGGMTTLKLVASGVVERYPLWAALLVGIGFVFVFIGLAIEATTRRAFYKRIALVYGLLGHGAKNPFGDAPEKLWRVRAILQERGLGMRKK
jgi:hypothetical protein